MRRVFGLVVVVLVSVFVARDLPGGTGDYAVVMSKETAGLEGWRRVADALGKKHDATTIIYEGDPAEALPALKKQFPRYACFVATPEEATRQFVASVHRVARRLDEDPYSDLFWGILTGYDAENALRIARHKEPLLVRKGAAGTEIALEMFDEGIWYCELKKNRKVAKELNGKPSLGSGPDDTTEALAQTLTDFKADLFVTSGHATERDWQIGYSYRNGTFRCENGQLYGRDLKGRKIPIESGNPKVYLPVGNCLMGHIKDRDSMALAFMNSAGVNQMIGYTVLTWYGYSGWGVLDYFVEQPGRYTFSEAFFANQAALVHRLNTYFPDIARMDVPPGRQLRQPIQVSSKARTDGLRRMDGMGLLFDRDVVAFYGDPAWEARMPKKSTAWEQAFSVDGDLFTFEVKPQWGEKSFAPVNKNGSQRGGRPIVHFFPNRLGKATLVEGAELRPTITDDFILIPNPGTVEKGRAYRVRFRAKSWVNPNG